MASMNDNHGILNFKGWAMHYLRHHGRFHYYDNELKAICGNRKSILGNTKNMQIIENPRPSKLCHTCLVHLRLPVPEIKRIA